MGSWAKGGPCCPGDNPRGCLRNDWWPRGKVGRKSSPVSPSERTQPAGAEWALHETLAPLSGLEETCAREDGACL